MNEDLKYFINRAIIALIINTIAEFSKTYLNITVYSKNLMFTLMKKEVRQ
jgi:hypothetical protein